MTTKIEWCDKVWNPTGGCKLVSPGCTNCYAMRFAHRNMGGHYGGLTRLGPNGPVWTGEIKLFEQRLLEPLRWRKPCRVFVDSMSDLFHEGVPDRFIGRVIAVISLTPHIDYIMLTKREERMEKILTKIEKGSIRDYIWHLFDTGKVSKDAADQACARLEQCWPLPNLHLGVSIENQETADKRIPSLLRTPAAVRVVSLEPLLGPIKLHTDWLNGHEEAGTPFSGARTVGGCEKYTPPLDWVIVGGESGPGARPMNPDWARSIRDQCVAAGVPFFFKQWGEWGPSATAPASKLFKTSYWNEQGEPCGEFEGAVGANAWRVGKKRAGRLLDGREWSEFPGARA